MNFKLLILLLSIILCSCNFSNVEKKFFENGNLKETAELKNDKRNGKLTTYYMNGNVESVYNLKDGVRNGKFSRYYETGELWQEGTLQDDLAQGRVFFYTKNGNVIEEHTYRNNQIFAFKKYDVSGKLITDTIVPQFTFENDTIQLGDEVILKVESIPKDNHTLQLLIGPLGINSLDIEWVTDTVFMQDFEENKVSYSYTADSIGTFALNGLVTEMVDGELYISTPFKFNYVVLDKK